jgi:hypothetical protein
MFYGIKPFSRVWESLNLSVFYDEDYIDKNVTKTFRKSKNVIRRKFPFKNVKV